MAANTVPVECVVEHRTLTAFAVGSATRSLRHTVRINATTAAMTCSCEAGRLGRHDNCRHRRAVIAHLYAVTGAERIEGLAA